MSLAHQPSTAASMRAKGRQLFGKDADHQHHPSTAEAAEMRHQDVATTDTEPPHPSNASQTLFRTRQMLPSFQAGAKAVEGSRATRERPGEIEGKATEKMKAARASVRIITMPFHNKTRADRSHHPSLAAAGIALVASIGALAL